MADTGSLEPSPEALAWARRADAWAQQPAAGQGGELEPVSRWSEVAPTGGQTTYTADGVGWRTETAEWLAAEQTARWRQTTEWRSASGDHGWRSTTEAWQTGGNAEGFTPPVDPSTRQQLAISGTAWPTPQSDDPQSAPPETGAQAGPWQPFTESTPPWEQSAAEARPAWQQFTSPTPPWQQGSAAAPPWQQGSAGTAPWQPGDPAGAAPAQRTPDSGPAWQQLVEPTPEGAPTWQNGAAWRQNGAAAGQNGAAGGQNGTPSWRDSVVARQEAPPSWAAPDPAAPSWQQSAPIPPQAGPSWQGRADTPDRADTPSWQTPAADPPSWRAQAPGASSAAYTTSWSGGLADGSHLVREDDRDRWRREAAAGMTGVGEASVGRRRALEPDARPGEGTGWAAPADAPSWTGRAEAVGPRAISDRPSWQDRTDTPDRADTPSWHTRTEAPRWQDRTEAPSRPDAGSWRDAQPDTPSWQGRAEAPGRTNGSSWQGRAEAPGRPEAPGWQGRAEAPARPDGAPSWRDRTDAPTWQDAPGRSGDPSRPDAPDWRDRTETPNRFQTPNRRARDDDAADWRDRTEIRDWPDSDDRDYRYDRDRDDRGSRADAPDWRDRTDIRDWPARPAIAARPYSEERDDRPQPPDWRDRTDLPARPRSGSRREDDEREDPPTDWRNRSDGWRAEPDSGSWSRGEMRRDGWRGRDDDPDDEDTGDPGWRDAGPDTGDWRRGGRPATDPWTHNAADTGMIPMSWEQPGSDTGSWRAPETGPIDPEVFRRDGGARHPDANWPADNGPQQGGPPADWRAQIRQEDGLPRPGDAVTEIRQRIDPDTWQRAGQEPAQWQREEREQAERGSAPYRAADTGDWRKDLTPPADLADGESRRFGTQEFIPFRPSGSAPVPTSAASAPVAPRSAPPAPVQVPPPQGSFAQGPLAQGPLAQGRENLLVASDPSAAVSSSRWQDPPDTQWPPRGAVTGSYERRAVGSLPGPSGRSNNLLEPEGDDVERSNGGPLAAVGYTVIWYGVPVILFVLYILVFNGGQQAHALTTLAAAAPQFGLSLVLSMLVAVGLRWASGSWKAASVGLAAAVMGGGLATVLTSAITGNSLS